MDVPNVTQRIMESCFCCTHGSFITCFIICDDGGHYAARMDETPASAGHLPYELYSVAERCDAPAQGGELFDAAQPALNQAWDGNSCYRREAPVCN